MNFDRLRYVAERAELGEQREALFAVTIPERPRQLPQISASSWASARSPSSTTAIGTRDVAHIFVGVAVASGAKQRGMFARAARGTAIDALDMTDNEMAKLHVRHMVGGHAPAARRKPATLRISRSGPARWCNSSTSMGGRWNISLFHYRNHGAAFGRVLSACRCRGGRVRLPAFSR